MTRIVHMANAWTLALLCLASTHESANLMVVFTSLSQCVNEHCQSVPITAQFHEMINNLSQYNRFATPTQGQGRLYSISNAVVLSSRGLVCVLLLSFSSPHTSGVSGKANLQLVFFEPALFVLQYALDSVKPLHPRRSERSASLYHFCIVVEI